MVHLAQRRRLRRRCPLDLHGTGRGCGQAQVGGHRSGELQVDVGQDFVDFPSPDGLTLHLAQLEAVGLDDVLLLGRAHALEEQPRLGEMIAERVAALADLVRIDTLLVALETSILCGRRRFLGPAAIDGVGS